MHYFETKKASAFYATLETKNSTSEYTQRIWNKKRRLQISAAFEGKKLPPNKRRIWNKRDTSEQAPRVICSSVMNAVDLVGRKIKTENVLLLRPVNFRVNPECVINLKLYGKHLFVKC